MQLGETYYCRKQGVCIPLETTDSLEEELETVVLIMVGTQCSTNYGHLIVSVATLGSVASKEENHFISAVCS